jgi:hypothetical protein
LGERMSLLFRRIVNDKKQFPNLKKCEHKRPFVEIPDELGILVIAEGCFGEVVKRSGRFFNANYPPEDVSQTELKRFWGEPRKKDQNLLDNIKAKGKKGKEP